MKKPYKTTNCPPSDWSNIYPNKRIEMVSILINCCLIILRPRLSWRIWRLIVTIAFSTKDLLRLKNREAGFWRNKLNTKKSNQVLAKMRRRWPCKTSWNQESSALLTLFQKTEKLKIIIAYRLKKRF